MAFLHHQVTKGTKEHKGAWWLFVFLVSLWLTSLAGEYHEAAMSKDLRIHDL